MEKLNYPCPCGGRVKWACGSKYFPEGSMEIVEDKLKEKGLWGSRKEVKIWKSGSSVVIRLPTEISRSMDLAKVIQELCPNLPHL